MLIEFSVSNFRSFNSTQTFSMSAGNLKEESADRSFNLSNSEYLENLTLLKSAVVYGANAAGKSNFIKAIGAMKRIVTRSAKSGQRGDLLPVSPFKLNSKTVGNPSEFEVIFVSNGVRYQYGFSATSEQVYDEWLFAYPKGRAQRWFSRVWDKSSNDYDWEFGTSLLGEKQVWKKATRKNALFLSTAVQLNSEQLKPVFDWFSDTCRLIGVNGFPTEFSAKYCHKGESEEVLRFLKEADLGIDHIDITPNKFDVNEVLPDDMPDALREALVNEMKDIDQEIYEVTTYHNNEKGEAVPFEIDEESTGTQKLFAYSGPWLDVLKNGYVLVVDELHDNLHPRLVQYLVELFHQPKTNPKNAQLIFTTHETSILNQAVFRRDQVWFTEKNDLSETEIYPLTDFKPRKGRENLEAAYLAGRYGAVPYVKSSVK
ncbi:ATP-binding protein [Thiomicrorhabdus sp. zzn3]|uniref:AAA family ATPase n=1 Tax=Thiomicrorhabdus sp. zzn3 TaxID=3039775 RepID=UPI002436B2BB|nr:ATP-binding protein [Thiomicrorhabdus sp. zzn3]MDG6777691.1 ATP-binding protein [Thiomicrorhabdus sp. zzn3]